ncbi:hypothetical protein CYLTODRAFT_459845 [Cylindrobasidium torrendii FP15055 ss-10]|uniref:Uncharacterized protein n=1 Tax=Cylindrobasidium torrendii FP15055 ss-10 TaxID=1314674 RepID=A0A0D7AUD8_9AGAR|nr:hypothetical protein CYLTODRAFT_459845 [Cylindrobasidium torrendii FP15055 ss-10]
MGYFRSSQTSCILGLHSDSSSFLTTRRASTPADDLDEKEEDQAAENLGGLRSRLMASAVPSPSALKMIPGLQMNRTLLSRVLPKQIGPQHGFSSHAPSHQLRNFLSFERHNVLGECTYKRLCERNIWAGPTSDANRGHKQRERIRDSEQLECVVGATSPRPQPPGADPPPNEDGRHDDPPLRRDLESVQPTSDVHAVITNNFAPSESIPEPQEQNLTQIARERDKKNDSDKHNFQELMEREQSGAANVKGAHEMIQELVSQLERQKTNSHTILKAFVKVRDALGALKLRLEVGGVLIANGHGGNLEVTKDPPKFSWMPVMGRLETILFVGASCYCEQGYSQRTGLTWISKWFVLYVVATVFLPMSSRLRTTVAQEDPKSKNIALREASKLSKALKRNNACVDICTNRRGAQWERRCYPGRCKEHLGEFNAVLKTRAVRSGLRIYHRERTF